MNHSEALGWVRLSMTSGLGRDGRRLAVSEFGSPAELFSCDRSRLISSGFSDKAADRLLDEATLAKAEKSLKIIERIGCSIIPITSTQYPLRLRETADPPSVLYCLGELPQIDALPVIAVVGTRKCDSEGKFAARKISREMVSLGGVVCTGLASGIDSFAAESALAGDGITVGVLGTSIDKVYPAENSELFERVKARGCILSEYPPLYSIGSKGFPARNRIIAGLSLGVVVIQSPLKSGALITAAHAVSEGRDVFAVPGSIGDGLSEGSNRLLSDGAILVQSGRDVMKSYVSRTDLTFIPNEGEAGSAASAPAKKKKTIKHYPPEETAKDDEAASGKELEKLLSSLTENQLKIVTAITEQEKHIDDIILATGLPAAAALSELTLLQLKGVVLQSPGKRFSLNITKRR